MYGSAIYPYLPVSVNLEETKEELKKINLTLLQVEGRKGGDWILVDAGDVIIHLFRNEVRDYYNLEKMWEYEINDNVSINS